MSRPLHRLAVAAGALAALALPAACRTAAARDGTPPPYVVFDNQSLSQASVYLLAGDGGLSTRIGTVMPGRREALRIPLSALGGTRSVRFGAQLVGSGAAPRSGTLTLAPGDSLEVTLAPGSPVLTVLPLRGR